MSMEDEGWGVGQDQDHNETESETDVAACMCGEQDLTFFNWTCIIFVLPDDVTVILKTPASTC